MKKKEYKAIVREKSGILYLNIKTKNKWESYPLPPHTYLEPGQDILEGIDTLAAEIRLWESRTGIAAWWKAGEKTREALNRAPFNPMLRAEVKSFEVLERVRSDYTPADNEIIQGGKKTANFRAFVKRPMFDPIRPLIKRLIKVGSRELQYRYEREQGHLKITAIHGRWWSSEALVRAFQERARMAWTAWIYNHWIKAADRYFYFGNRVIDGEMTAVVLPEAGKIIIASPDHLTSPIEIDVRKPSENNYVYFLILEHPIPQPDNPDNMD